MKTKTIVKVLLLAFVGVGLATLVVKQSRAGRAEEGSGAATEQAARELGMEFELVKVTDINDIVGFGVMSTPALAIDGKVAMVGRVGSTEEIKRLLQQGSEKGVPS